MMTTMSRSKTVRPNDDFPIKRTHFVFDIETGAAPHDEVEPFCPTIRPHKTIRDEVKQAAYIDGKKNDWFDKAALSPITGRVLVIGVRVEEVNTMFHVNKEGSEKNVLKAFFEMVRKHSDQKWIGHNCHAFDWPFIRGRAMANDLSMPSGIITSIMGHRWVNYGSNCRDTMLAWNPDPTARISLSNLGRVLGLGTKLMDGGKYFDELYAENPDLALKYCERDLELTDEIWDRIGL
jgi:DNA polymerase elongation subunit (family B)